MKTPSAVEYQLLALVVRERSGREVAKAYQAETGKSISYGTLYVVLGRLQEQGWVKVRDDQDVDGRIRYFKITGLGAKALASTRRWYRSQAKFGFRCSG